MIIRQEDGCLILIRQHDHGLFAGWIASHWGNDAIPTPREPSNGLMLATQLHDIGWDELDDHPILNPDKNLPYSFLDEPLSLRLPAYRNGITKVAQRDPYAGLLCSLHYTSFFPRESLPDLGLQAVQFVKDEEQRQESLVKMLENDGRSLEAGRAMDDLGLLKLWDEISLYICLNRPGVAKKEEHPWYRDGFRETHLGEGSVQRTPAAVRFLARWLDESTVTISPFPFPAPITGRLPYRIVSRQVIVDDEVEEALRRGRTLQQEITWLPDR
jgi:Protein of unknown function (DUF3891)